MIIIMIYQESIIIHDLLLLLYMIYHCHYLSLSIINNQPATISLSIVILNYR